MNRALLAFLLLAGTAAALVFYGDPEQIARASDSVSLMLRQRSTASAPAVQISRGQGGEFALRAKINGVAAPMVIDTGATSVVLTWETAKAIGLPLEMLEYDVDVETAGGHTKAARLTLDRLAVDPELFGEPAPFATMKDVFEAMMPYIEAQLAQGTRLHSITRHFVGAFHGVPGARAFRRHLAENGVRPGAGAAVLRDAIGLVEGGAAAAIAA